MVVEIGGILTHVLGPEWNWRIEVTISELRKSIKLLGVGAVE